MRTSYIRSADQASRRSLSFTVVNTSSSRRPHTDAAIRRLQTAGAENTSPAESFFIRKYCASIDRSAISASASLAPKASVPENQRIISGLILLLRVIGCPLSHRPAQARISVGAGHGLAVIARIVDRARSAARQGQQEQQAVATK